MTQHPSQLDVEREIGRREAVGDLVISSANKPEATEREQGGQANRGGLRKLLIGTLAVAIVAGASWFGWRYWTVGRFRISTDDAYVQADNVAIAPRVAGHLVEVFVGDNEPVKVGQALAKIDDRDYLAALDQARFDVATSKAVITGKRAAIETQRSVVDAAKATVAVDESNLIFARQENQRYADLAKTGYGSLQNAQSAAARISGAQASLARDTASLASAIKQIDELKADLAQAQAKLGRDEAVERQAVLNLGYTNIVAPADGVVGNRTLRVGQFVQPGTQLMSIVPLHAVYVVANYKETQLTEVVAGQMVEIEVDMFPGRVFRGRVDSLSPSSGQTFALLPPDNATGNFTKVVQRIPVRIALDDDARASGELRPGMSVEPSIDVSARPSARATAPN
ncbi:HlyD family secretion protein [Chenggangzhangella methanolivorans]|uniref:HlyD family secretion protein n=1 Tax=Chenggangzhangella methanolivorans TaxID=1437009 RepID=UPI00360E1990